MSRASELMDSRKFMAARTEYYNAIMAGNEAKETESLDAMLDMALNMERAPMIHQFTPPAIGKPRGIEAFIPIPQELKDRIAHSMDVMRDIRDNPPKPKRKRRTKAEMAAANTGVDAPLQAHERIQPKSEVETQKEQAPHIIAMLAKVQARADAVQAPFFDVVFDRNEGMFIQELPMYLEAGGRFGVIENKGFNSQYGWVVKIGRK